MNNIKILLQIFNQRNRILKTIFRLQKKIYQKEKQLYKVQNYHLQELKKKECKLISTGLQQFLKERQTNLDDCPDLIDYVDAEVDMCRNANNHEYLSMIEKMQGMLKDVEKERDQILKDFEYVNQMWTNEKDKLSQLQSKYKQQEQKMQELLRNMDNNNQTLEDNKEKQKKLLKKVWNMDEKYTKEKNKYEKQIQDLEQNLRIKLENLENEKNFLSVKLQQSINQKVSQQDLQDIQQQRIKKFEEKIENLEEENNYLSNYQTNLQSKLKSITNERDTFKTQLIEIKSDYASEISKIEIRYTNLIKDKDEIIAQLKEDKIQNLAHKDEQQELDDYMINNLNDLNEDDFNMEFRESDFDIRQRNSTHLETIQDDNGENQLENLKEIDNKQQELNYLKEIEIKDKEIKDLRDQIIKLQQSQSNTQKNELQKLQEQIKIKDLKIKHLQEKKNSLEEENKQNFEHFDKENKKLEQMYIDEKINGQMSLSQKEVKIMQLMKQQKNLKMTISLYEKQIIEFNKTLSKKK